MNQGLLPSRINSADSFIASVGPKHTSLYSSFRLHCISFDGGLV